MQEGTFPAIRKAFKPMAPTLGRRPTHQLPVASATEPATNKQSARRAVQGVVSPSGLKQFKNNLK